MAWRVIPIYSRYGEASLCSHDVGSPQLSGTKSIGHEQIDRELLISLVEQKPLVWNKFLDIYKDKVAKTAAWRRNRAKGKTSGKTKHRVKHPSLTRLMSICQRRISVWTCGNTVCKKSWNLTQFKHQFIETVNTSRRSALPNSAWNCEVNFVFIILEPTKSSKNWKTKLEPLDIHRDLFPTNCLVNLETMNMILNEYYFITHIFTDYFRL